MTPDTAMDSAHRDQGINTTLFANAVAAVIDKVYSLTGKNSILVSHSQGGFPGWEAPRYTDHIASIIAIELKVIIIMYLFKKLFQLYFIMEIILVKII